MVEIRNLHGDILVQLGEDQGCTDDLSTAFLDELDLSNANLEGADLSNAYIGFCNLTGANLRNADLSNAEIECCEVAGADFSGADLSNAQIDITTDIWLDAITDDETLFPSHHRPSYR
ncbi:MAG: pentapeptide repeat-containing protein [Bacteroidales bacterium]|nr:pentapeptide repeat-containing protein [Bacteroidales bacterium]